MPYDIDSFDEVEATEGDFHTIASSELNDAIAEAELAISKSEELCKRFDPDDEPYKSKYLAREALRIAISKLTPHAEKKSSEEERGGIAKSSKESLAVARDMIARLNWRMAAIYMDVQEAGGAKDFLEKSVSHWRSRVVTEINKIPLDTDGKSKLADSEGNDEEDMMVAELVIYCKECATTEKSKLATASANSDITSDFMKNRSVDLEVLEALSHLGIYHHNFEHFKHGLILLKLCDELIKDLDTTQDDVKSVRTQVCFYLAQAYAAMSRPHQSAHYCKLTLEWQLSSENLNAKEWYSNCAGLVDYFINQERYRDAEICLRACDIIVETRMSVATAPATRRAMDESTDRLNEAKADMDRRWGIFHLNILQDAAQLDAEDRVNHREAEATVDFALLNIPPCSALLPSQVLTFEEARIVFKAALSRHVKAQQFYVLDGYVTDHVALCRDVSAMYKWLSAFETDEKRILAMLGRRAAALMPIVEELGTNAYADTLKQISFEVAEIYMEMCEVKLERIAQKKAKNEAYVPKDSEITKSNEYAKLSIKYFEKFTNFFRKAAPVPLFPMPGKKDDESDEETEYDDEEDKQRKRKKKAEKQAELEEERLGGKLDIPSDELGVHLRAHLYIARMHGKILPLSSSKGEERVIDLKNSLKKYEWLRKFARERLALLPKTKPKPTLLSDPEEVWIDPKVCFKAELEMCDQMVELLPLQISRSYYMNQSMVV